MSEEDLKEAYEKGVFAHDPELQEQVRKLLEEWDDLVDEIAAKRLIDEQDITPEVLKKLRES